MRAVVMGKKHSLIAGLVMLLAPPFGHAQPKLDKVNVAYVSTAGTFAVTWIAKEAKLFRKYGLDAQVIQIPGSPRLVQAVLSGDVQFGHTGGVSTANAIVHGADLAILAQTSRGFSSHLIVKATIESMEALQNKKIGVPQYGSTADLFLREALRRWNLEPDRDVAIIQVGGMAESFAALASGALDGVVIPTELAFRARKLGFRDILPFQKIDLKEMGASLIATRPFVMRSGNIVQRFLMAFVEATFIYKSDPNFSLPVLQKYTKNQDLEMLSTVRDEAINLLDFPPYPRKEDFMGSLDRLRKESAKSTAQIKMETLQEVLDAKHLRELEESGFVARTKETYKQGSTR